MQDLFGLKLTGHPNPRRCALHDDWPEVFPLRKDFDLRTQLPPFQGERHKFRTVEGEGVFQVPVGPVHAGIIEPGHFLFSVAGEPVLYLQLRLFYTHKGTEKLFENLPRAALRPAGGEHFRRFQFRPRDGLLPRRRTRRGRGSAAARPGAALRLSGTGTALQSHRRHRRDLHGRGLRHRQHARACGSRSACCASTNNSPATVSCAAWPAWAACVSIWTRNNSNPSRELVAELRPEFDSLVHLIAESSSHPRPFGATGVLKPESRARPRRRRHRRPRVGFRPRLAPRFSTRRLRSGEGPRAGLSSRRRGAPPAGAH